MTNPTPPGPTWNPEKQVYDYPNGPPTAPPELRKSWPARHKVLTSLGVAAILGIGWTIASGGGNPTTPITAASSPTVTPRAPAPKSSVKQEITPPPATAAPPAAPVAKPVSYRGTGDSVVRLSKAAGPMLARIVGRGSDNFIVTATGSSDEQLLVNEIGDYTGVRLLDPLDDQRSTKLVIKASGPWSVSLSALETSPRFDAGTYRGRGDAVVVYNGTADTLRITATGSDSNFIVESYGGNSGQDLLVNEIGSYTGTVPVETPVLLAITASGRWTLTVGG